MNPPNQNPGNTVSSAFNVSDPLGVTRVRVQGPEIVRNEPPAIQAPRRIRGTKRLAQNFEAYTGWLTRTPAENDLPVQQPADGTAGNAGTPGESQTAATPVVPTAAADQVHYVPDWKEAIADKINTALESPHATMLRPAQKSFVSKEEAGVRGATHRIDNKHDLLKKIDGFNRLAAEARQASAAGHSKELSHPPEGRSSRGPEPKVIQRIDRGHRAAGVSGIVMPPNIDPSTFDETGGVRNSDVRNSDRGQRVQSQSRGGSVSGTQVRMDEEHVPTRESRLLELTEQFVRKQSALKNHLAVSASNDTGIPPFETGAGTATIEPPAKSKVRRKRLFSVRNSVNTDAPVSAGTSQLSSSAVSFAPGSGSGKANAAPPAKQQTAASSQLPVNVVSWDVDDFLWPSEIVPLTKVASAGHLLKVTDVLLNGTHNRLVITSPVRGHGSTTIAMVLSRTLAASGRDVLLIDADLGSPALSRRLGIPINYSWLDLINGNRHPGDAIIRSNETGVSVLPLAGILTRVNWPRFFYDSLSPIVEKVRSHFDAVIIDVGPLDQLTNELSSANRLVDSVLVVHDPERSGGSAISRKALSGFGVQKVVFAENFIP